MLEKYIKILDSKSLDGKIKFLKNVFLRKNFTFEDGIYLTNYVFSNEQALLLRREEKDELYDMIFKGFMSKNIDQQIEIELKYLNVSDSYIKDYEMREDMESKHNRWIRNDERKNKIRY